MKAEELQTSLGWAWEGWGIERETDKGGRDKLNRGQQGSKVDEKKNRQFNPSTNLYSTLLEIKTFLLRRLVVMC